MIDELKRRALHRTKILAGQLRGLERMIDEEQYCVDIVTQSLAIQKSLRSLDRLIVENHLRTHAAHDLAHGGGRGARSTSSCACTASARRGTDPWRRRRAASRWRSTERGLAAAATSARAFASCCAPGHEVVDPWPGRSRARRAGPRVVAAVRRARRRRRRRDGRLGVDAVAGLRPRSASPSAPATTRPRPRHPSHDPRAVGLLLEALETGAGRSTGIATWTGSAASSAAVSLRRGLLRLRRPRQRAGEPCAQGRAATRSRSPWSWPCSPDSLPDRARRRGAGDRGCS